MTPEEQDHWYRLIVIIEQLEKHVNDLNIEREKLLRYVSAENLALVKHEMAQLAAERLRQIEELERNPVFGGVMTPVETELCNRKAEYELLQKTQQLEQAQAENARLRGSFDDIRTQLMSPGHAEDNIECALRVADVALASNHDTDHTAKGGLPEVTGSRDMTDEERAVHNAFFEDQLAKAAPAKQEE